MDADIAHTSYAVCCVQGIIVVGAVRDSAQLSRMRIGVKALATNPTRSGKDSTGEQDVTVHYSGQTFTPGHWVSLALVAVIVLHRLM